MIEIGYNFNKKSLDKIKKFKNPVLDIHKNKINKNSKYTIFLNKSQFNYLLENGIIKNELTDAKKIKIYKLEIDELIYLKWCHLMQKILLQNY